MSTHQGSPIRPNVLNRWTTYIIAAIINLIDCQVLIQSKRVRDVHFAMNGVSSINHLELIKEFTIRIHKKRPIRKESISHFISIDFVINRNGDQFTIIDTHLGL